MSRAIQRLIAFAIISSILLTGCGSRPVSFSGLHADAAEHGWPSTLNFKLTNPTSQKIVLTNIQLEPLNRDINRNGRDETFIYSYRPEMHQYVSTDDQGVKDEIRLEIYVQPGQIINFQRDGQFYVNLIFNPPTTPPEIEHQSGLPRGQLMSVKFTYRVVQKDADDSGPEVRSDPIDLVLEAYID